MPIDTWDKWNKAKSDVYFRYNAKRSKLNMEFSKQVRGLKDIRKKEVFSEEYKAKQKELTEKAQIELDILEEIREDIRKSEQTKNKIKIKKNSEE